MLEYIFFESRFRDLFTQWLDQNAIPYETAGDEDELLVLIDEDIADEIEEKIEEEYDRLLDLQAESADEQDAEDDSIHVVGVQYSTSEGDVRQVRLTPYLANQITQCMTHEELQAFIQTIADQVLHPDDRPLCKK